jgi:zinc D-Ala-D-Ala carboxypeptidase
MTKTIQRNSSRKTTEAVLPLVQGHANSLTDTAVPGNRSINDTIKLLNQKAFSKVIESATVLELISPPSSPGSKTKYVLPHLNMADDKYIEGYLLKIRLPEDVGSLIDPQDILELNNTESGAKSAFSLQTSMSSDKKTTIIRYCEAVANHRTFAPLNPNESTIPHPNSKVRVYCFTEPHMSSGGTIEGLYEIIDKNNSLFEQGTLNNFLGSLRNYVEKSKNIMQSTFDNVASFISQTPEVADIPTDQLETEDEKGQELEMSLTDGVMLSENFSLAQLTKNKNNKDLDNTPNEQQKENLRLLCNDVLEPIRAQFGELIVTSGYRSPEINLRVGGSKTGDHPRGMAADIVPVSGTKNLLEIANWIKDNLQFKQVLLEMWRPEANRGWIHVSYDLNNNKKEALELYKDENGKTKSRSLKKA